MRTRLLLLSPWAYDTAFKTRVVDGDLYGLWAHAVDHGIDCVAVDGQHRVVPYPDLEQVIAEYRPDAVLAHLWTADNYGEVLEAQCRHLAELRKATGVPLVAWGYLAVTAAEDILDAGAADGIKVPGGFRLAPLPRPRVRQLVADGAPVSDLLAADVTGFASLRLLPAHALDNVDAQTTFSVRASRGCRARCSFCSYNADVGRGWYARDLADVVDDMAAVLERTEVRRLALSDADFGGSEGECLRRAEELRGELEGRGLAGQVPIALATRPSTLSGPALEHFAAGGVDTILIGVETLDMDALHGVFAKRHGRLSLPELAALADGLGISLVASYILWHPWQTIAGLRRELDEIVAFGRHRVPQFLTRSILQVQPGTAIEGRLAASGGLIAGPFRRSFRFEDPAVEALYDQLTDWYRANVDSTLSGIHEDQDDAYDTLARLKIAELDHLQALLDA